MKRIVTVVFEQEGEPQEIEIGKPATINMVPIIVKNGDRVTEPEKILGEVLAKLDVEFPSKKHIKQIADEIRDWKKTRA